MDKLIPAWDEKYSINDEKIDAQHQKLFELAAKIENAVYKFVQRDELKEILTELFNYMKDHFSNEEDYMQEISYPYLNEHKIMHKNIIHDMSHLIQNIKTTNDLKEKLYTIMSDWLLEHILHHDVMIGNWLSEQLLAKQEEELEKLQQEDLQQEKQYENNPNPSPPQIKKEYDFIYSCPCRINHFLSYIEHLDIICHKKQLRCKKCQKNLFYVRSEIKTEKRNNDVSKVG
ncbi:hemerythrin family non-heme iron protein [Campylobacter coli]|uniref:bacteriohemerythrin n=1 Tax=Campylobacter coli TaxID=195 RepID=UPI00071731EA|nr:hemerythrin family protein [Campylobacter coli]EAI1019122.1 bacteriohemerythrin [Campylobacter coli]EJM4832687.1 hemerythrin family protein [Campylobacter coli]KRS67467.1 hemerythrin family non-heme iron protein [Campylobacter coli]HEG0314241.1 hemerythrin family protein [Campylobacter coli]